MTHLPFIIALMTIGLGSLAIACRAGWHHGRHRAGRRR
jgi:hypothetical protein